MTRRAEVRAASGASAQARWRGTAMTLAAMSSVQLGAAYAVGLFPLVGAAGMVFLRLTFAAAIFCLATRPRLRGRTDWSVIAAFGVVLAVMNVSFYEAISRLPLGMVVAIEFMGPLAVAVRTSRGGRSLSIAGLAGIGVVLLVVDEFALDPLGVGFAVAAGAAWAGYILLTREIGRRSAGADGLALSMMVAAVVVLPLGLGGGATRLILAPALVWGAVVAMLSSVIPYSLELAALRRLSPATFGVLMALNPAIAAIAGWAVLAQALNARQILAIALIVGASAAAVASARPAATAAAGA